MGKWFKVKNVNDVKAVNTMTSYKRSQESKCNKIYYKPTDV